MPDECSCRNIIKKWMRRQANISSAILTLFPNVDLRRKVMQFLVRAEDGDLITIDGANLSFEQGLIHVRLHNHLYHADELDAFSLSADNARQMARALLAVADMLDNPPPALALQNVRASLGSMLTDIQAAS
jgi:hypothetical protein